MKYLRDLWKSGAMVVSLHFITGVVLQSTFVLCAGHVMFRLFFWIGTKVGTEIIVGLC